MKLPIRWKMDEGVCDAYQVKNATSSETHGHQHFLITLITRGEGVQTLNGVDINFSKKDLFILSPADFHKNTLEFDKNYDYYGVKFNFDTLSPDLVALFQFDMLPIRITLSDRIYDKATEIFKELIREKEEGSEKIASSIYTKAILEELLIIIMREMPEKKEKETNSFAVKMLSYLYSHFHEDIYVIDAASYIGYTPNHFNTLFRSVFGVPFASYLRTMRIDYAKNLLLASNMPATEIALESGFTSLSHFSRCFKAEVGVSPQKYRKDIF